MSIFLADRVQETGTGSGTGAITRTGNPPLEYRTFDAAGMAEGQQSPVLIIDPATHLWEISLCTKVGSTLTRDVFKSASSGATFVDFDAGAKSIALVPSALDVVTSDFGLNLAARIDVASAATTNIGAAGGNWLRITGTTTITAFDSPTAGYWRWLEFGGALTLTNNANIVVYGGASVTTSAGMLGLALYVGAGVWKVWVFPTLLFKAAGSDIRTGTDDAKYLTAKSAYDAAAEVTLTYAASYTPDLTTFLNAAMTLTGNLTFNNPSAGMTPGRSGFIRFIQDGTGSRTIAFGSQWDIAGGAPTASTAAGTIDGLAYTVISASLVYGVFSRAFA